MKNYALNREDSKNFIKCYRIEDGKIIATLGTNEEYIISYSKENEQIILSRMEKQVENSNAVDVRTRERQARSAVFSIFTGGFVVFLFLSVGHLNLFGWITALALSATCLMNIRRHIKEFLLELDIEKSNYYLKNEKELNGKLKINHNMTLGMSKKGTKQLEQDARKTPVFDINVIDKYSLKDLKTLLKNIQREENFGFVEPESTSDLQYIKK